MMFKATVKLIVALLTIESNFGLICRSGCRHFLFPHNDKHVLRPQHELFVMEPDLDHIFTLQEEIYLLDISKEKFHTLWDDLYTIAPAAAGYDALSSRVPLDRFVGKFAIQINDIRLWVPMLIDTGAPRTFLCEYTLNKFNTNSAIVRSFSLGSFKNLEPRIYKDSTHFSDLNILGMDVLLMAFPTFRESMDKQMRDGFQMIQPPSATDIELSKRERYLSKLLRERRELLDAGYIARDINVTEKSAEISNTELLIKQLKASASLI